jgi:hypothetical protein
MNDEYERIWKGAVILGGYDAASNETIWHWMVRWLINLKEIQRKQSWHNQGTILEFSWMEIPKASVRIATALAEIRTGTPPE